MYILPYLYCRVKLPQCCCCKLVQRLSPFMFINITSFCSMLFSDYDDILWHEWLYEPGVYVVREYIHELLELFWPIKPELCYCVFDYSFNLSLCCCRVRMHTMFSRYLLDYYLEVFWHCLLSFFILFQLWKIFFLRGSLQLSRLSLHLVSSCSLRAEAPHGQPRGRQP